MFQILILVKHISRKKFDPIKYEITGVDFEDFLQLLKSLNLRYTRFSSPHPCKLCENGPVLDLVLQTLRKQQVDPMANTGFSKISYDGHISVTIFRENYNIETPNKGRYCDPLPPCMYSSVYDK